MKEVIIKKENIIHIADNKFLNLYNLNYNEGRPYFVASRRGLDDLACLKKEDYTKMIPDAVSCVFIVKTKDNEHRLILAREFRYPTGHFALGVPAGLIDKDDKDCENPLYEAAKRELFEECGFKMDDNDTISQINPLLFSSPGMTDESNGMVCVVCERDDLSFMDQSGCEKTEVFDGFVALTKEEALTLIKKGVDDRGLFYSVYTFIALMWFVSDMWK